MRGAASAVKMHAMFRPEELLDLKQFAYPDLFADCRHVWDALKKLPTFVKKYVKPAQRGEVVGTPFIGDDVQIGTGTVIEHGAVVKGPAIIGKNCEIRSGAYIRGNGHLIIVKNYDQAVCCFVDIVECLKGDAAAGGAVAKHGHDALVCAVAVAGDSHAKRCGNGCSGVTRADCR